MMIRAAVMDMDSCPPVKTRAECWEDRRLDPQRHERLGRQGGKELKGRQHPAQDLPAHAIAAFGCPGGLAQLPGGCFELPGLHVCAAEAVEARGVLEVRRGQLGVPLLTAAEAAGHPADGRIGLAAVGLLALAQGIYAAAFAIDLMGRSAQGFVRSAGLRVAGTHADILRTLMLLALGAAMAALVAFASA